MNYLFFIFEFYLFSFIFFVYITVFYFLCFVTNSNNQETVIRLLFDFCNEEWQYSKAGKDRLQQSLEKTVIVILLRMWWRLEHFCCSIELNKVIIRLQFLYIQDPYIVSVKKIIVTLHHAQPNMLEVVSMRKHCRVSRNFCSYIIHAPVNICCNEDKILRLGVYRVFFTSTTYNVSALDLETSNNPWRIY